MRIGYFDASSTVRSVEYESARITSPPTWATAARLLSMAAQILPSSLKALITIDTWQRAGVEPLKSEAALLIATCPAAKKHPSCECAIVASGLPAWLASAAPWRL